MNFEVVTEFEKKIAEFFGAPYAVATDSCTSSLELCLRLVKAKYISCPKRTYLSVPMLANKLNIELSWRDENWEDYYEIWNKDGDSTIIDAAVLWKRNSYVHGTMMCLSFQKQKHLSIGRVGIILLDDEWDAVELKKMSYDGREPGIPWREQNVSGFGFHVYAQPELCQIGLEKLEQAINTEPRKWQLSDWPDLTQMDIFKK